MHNLLNVGVNLQCYTGIGLQYVLHVYVLIELYELLDFITFDIST